MEVDPPSVSSCPSTVGASNSGTGGLKRSNSAPMINVLTASAVDYSPSLIKQEAKIRRFSSSNMSLNNLNSNLKIPDRINQIKREESHITDRETEHERQIQNAITMSNSWEDFSLEEAAMLPERRSRSCSESLSIITLPAMACGSPSPPPPQQRLGKQCFSPSMQVPVKNVAFLSSPTHSPNTKTLMRSMSPIARYSPLGKRKSESGDGEKFDCYLTPPKRLNTGTSPVRNITTTHPKFLTMSSNSSMDECCSPEPCIQPPRSLSISSLSPLSPLQSGKPVPMYSFTPVRDTRDMGATDSENSDMSESTDHILGPMDSPSFPGIKQAPPV